MAARSADIGDALVLWLNDFAARSWPKVADWHAERTWNPIVTLEELSDPDLRVQVVMDSRPNNVLVTRGEKQRDYGGFIVIRQKYPDSGDIPNDWIDNRVELAESMADKLLGLQPAGQPSGFNVWLIEETTIDPLCDEVALKFERTFEAIIEFKFREVCQR